jgi:hypothetical protein
MPATSASASSRRPGLLQQIEIASPCHAPWEDMVGNDKMRFCNQCSLHVYNLSAMTQDEAEQLILSREGRLCVRLYKRRDGTVITEDCPKGLERAARRVRLLMGAMASALAALLGADLFRPAAQCGVTPAQSPPLRPAVHVGPRPEPPAIKMMGKVARPPRGEQVMMGDVK